MIKHLTFTKMIVITLIVIINNNGYAQNTVNILPDTGNVGIGTTTPNEKLEVFGTSVFNGNINLNGNLNGNGTIYVPFVNSHRFTADTLFVDRIIGNGIDSTIKFGYHSIFINGGTVNNIFSDPAGWPSLVTHYGIGLGSKYSIGDNVGCVGIGFNAEAQALKSVAIGCGAQDGP